MIIPRIWGWLRNLIFCGVTGLGLYLGGCQTHDAIDGGLVRFLVKTDVRDTHGATILHLVAAHGRTDLIHLLTGSNADIEAKDAFGRTPLHYATLPLYVEAEMQAWGAIWARRSSESHTVCVLLASGANVNAQDSQGRTPLHYASESAQLGTAIELIRAGGELDLQDLRGNTALHYASGASSDEQDGDRLESGSGDVYVYVGHRPNLVRYLIDSGARLDTQSHDGRTALHYAVLANMPEVAGGLLHAGANPAIRDREGETALDLASASKNARMKQAFGLTAEGAERERSN